MRSAQVQSWLGSLLTILIFCSFFFFLAWSLKNTAILFISITEILVPLVFFTQGEYHKGASQLKAMLLFLGISFHDEHQKSRRNLHSVHRK